MTDFIDFVIHKYQVKIADSQPDETLVEAWLQWFEVVDFLRPLAKVPNTPPPAPKSLRGGETKRSFGGVGFLFLIYARGL